MTAETEIHIDRLSGAARVGLEQRVLARLMQQALAAGLAVDAPDVTNLYVALKSMPLLILYGPAHIGKVDLLQVFGEVLTGGDPLRFQSMLGHAWWAARSGNVAMGTLAQTRLNTEKIFSLIEDALRPENAGRMFMARLTRISPGEIGGLFTDLAFQLRHGQVMRLPAAHLARPIPYPSNLSLVATLDGACDDWTDADLLSHSTLIRWPGPAPASAGVEAVDGAPHAAAAPDGSVGGETLLRSAVRDARAAVRKLQRLGVWGMSRLSILFAAQTVLRTYGVDVPGSVPDAVLIYLANAWSEDGQGLFDLREERNLALALDYAVAQTLLPLAVPAMRQSAGLRDRLAGLLRGRLPRAARRGGTEG